MKKKKLKKHLIRSGRDPASGRFLPHNNFSVGIGRTPDAHVALLRKVALATATTQEIHEVFRSLIKQAKLGNVNAAKVLLQRVLGPVGDPVEQLCKSDPETYQIDEKFV